jgi:hypothetical protein
MEINRPEVVAEATAAFMEYQRAVDSNDAEAMNRLFWNSPSTVRFGPNGTLIGHAALSAYRLNRSHTGVPRILRNTVITTFGQDFATTNTETTRVGTSAIGRQSQSWIRTPDGWRIAAAHVSEQPGTGD